jgi:hypothetical protein
MQSWTIEVHSASTLRQTLALVPGPLCKKSHPWKQPCWEEANATQGRQVLELDEPSLHHPSLGTRKVSEEASR